MRQVPRSPLSFKLQRVANVPEHPPPSTRLMSCAHIANRRLSRIIGAREMTVLGTILLIILILILIGSLPTWPYSAGWGYYPSGGLGLILVIVIILVLLRGG